MSNRIKIESRAYEAIEALENYLKTTGITPLHKELIKIRASQINGCAYCINMHTKDARAAGETEQRIYALSAWRDAPFFTDEERAILALTEELTLISNHGVSDEVYAEAERLLGRKYLAEVYMAVITINAWNRIGVGLKMQPAA
ncbi:MAG: carboxymuconolactone decarboxylase family protein [Bacteroidetes bacterium]|nr:carboxymuconolactone decarboxylase family protein [Bacteroidota bacterium]